MSDKAGTKPRQFGSEAHVPNHNTTLLCSLEPEFQGNLNLNFKEMVCECCESWSRRDQLPAKD